MSAKTPLHVSPARYAFSAYLYRCLAASFAEKPARTLWYDLEDCSHVEAGDRYIYRDKPVSLFRQNAAPRFYYVDMTERLEGPHPSIEKAKEALRIHVCVEIEGIHPHTGEPLPAPEHKQSETKA